MCTHAKLTVEPQANVAFQESELERIGRLKQCMRSFCELERAAINSRSELLATLEEAIHSQSADEDLALFIAQERHVELTHKYTNAIGLMDLHVLKRCVSRIAYVLVLLL